jgi:hypothetical protein
MRLFQKIVIFALIFYCLIAISVYFAENWKSSSKSSSPLTKIIDPSTAIDSIRGYAKETIVLTPTLEQPFKSENFVPPISSYGLQVRPNNQSSVIEAGNVLPVNIEKHGSKYSFFSIDPISKNKILFAFGDVNINVSKDIDMHDQVIHQDGSFTFLEYVPNYKNRSLDLQLKRITGQGQVLWVWNSNKHISREHVVREPEIKSLKKKLRDIRRSYSNSILELFGSDIFQFLTNIYIPFPNRTIQLLDNQVGLLDHIHANSIEYLNDEKYILVSARHLDTLFIIEVKTGSIIWSLGGPYSTFTKNRVIGDPRGGFSHQHDARVFKNKLYLFDNANMQLGLPSRAVVYTFDMKNPNNCKFLFEYIEPYNRRRLSMGSVQPLDDDRVLIGWGGVPLGPDRQNTSVGASIVNMKNNRAEWQLDFKPSWTSYRARGY